MERPEQLEGRYVSGAGAEPEVGDPLGGRSQRPRKPSEGAEEHLAAVGAGAQPGRTAER